VHAALIFAKLSHVFAQLAMRATHFLLRQVDEALHRLTSVDQHGVRLSPLIGRRVGTLQLVQGGDLLV